MALRYDLDVVPGEHGAHVLGYVRARRRREVEPARAGQAECAVQTEDRGVVGERRLQRLLEPADPQPGAGARDAELRRPPAPRPLPHARPRAPPAMVAADRRVRAAAAEPVLRPPPRRPAAPRRPRHGDHLAVRNHTQAVLWVEGMAWMRMQERMDGEERGRRGRWL